MISLEAMLYKQRITFDAVENRIRYDSTWLLLVLEETIWSGLVFFPNLEKL